MRARSTLFLTLIAVLTSLLVSYAPAAHAAERVFAQDSESSDESGGDSGATDENEGSGSTGAEVGANEGQTETAEEETGPPWTYQMSRMILVILLLMALAIGLLYWRLVVQRQRRGI
jgi:cobalamin biosynthesis Mg chelatase CobN